MVLESDFRKYSPHMSRSRSSRQEARDRQACVEDVVNVFFKGEGGGWFVGKIVGRGDDNDVRVIEWKGGDRTEEDLPAADYNVGWRRMRGKHLDGGSDEDYDPGGDGGGDDQTDGEDCVDSDVVGDGGGDGEDGLCNGEDGGSDEDYDLGGDGGGDDQTDGEDCVDSDVVGDGGGDVVGDGEDGTGCADERARRAGGCPSPSRTQAAIAAAVVVLVLACYVVGHFVVAAADNAVPGAAIPKAKMPTSVFVGWHLVKVDPTSAKT